VPQGSWKDFANALGLVAKSQDASSLPRLIVAWGPSDFLLTRVYEVIRDVWKNRDQAGGEWTSIESADLTRDLFASLWEQKNLFGQASCTVLLRAEKKSDLARMFAAIPKPESIASHVVVLLGKDRLPAELAKQMERLRAHRIECVEPAPFEVQRFVMSLGRKYGLGLQQDASQVLIDQTGFDLARLDNEVRRLALFFAGSSGEKGVREIAPLLHTLKEEDTFKLDACLLEHDWAGAHKLLVDLLDRGEHALGLVGMLARHCRIALELKDEGTDHAFRASGSASSKIRLPAAILRKYNRHVEKTPKSRFVNALNLCADADARIKSSRIPEDLLLSGIIEELAGTASAKVHW
jgi:DNA polymerase III delta subunit